MPTNALRITPAYAGKSRCRCRSSASPKDHPRTCGEKGTSCQRMMVCEGSPPHMRGKVASKGLLRRNLGITPAHAGKSPDGGLHLHKARDHPRVCGEMLGMCSQYSTSLGSPPRMRGKEADPVIERAVQGITPAYAGKRRLVLHCNGSVKDHPHVCGEKVEPPAIWEPFKGSPPRMRGKEISGFIEDLTGRITPAYAGKSHSQSAPASAVMGSPPRMRGKGVPAPAHNPPSGITPAHAGKSSIATGRASSRWDHPRTCGEKISTVKDLPDISGSPPRMRGKARVYAGFPVVPGITPAHAGKSTSPSPKTA